MNALKSVRGMKMNIPFSKEKEIVRAAKLYWKDRVKEIKGLPINSEKMNMRKQIANIDDEDEDLSIE